jgi:hypothetical protein
MDYIAWRLPILPEIGIGLAIVNSAAKAQKLAVVLKKAEQIEKNVQLVEKGLAKVEKARATHEVKMNKKGRQGNIGTEGKDYWHF